MIVYPCIANNSRDDVMGQVQNMSTARKQESNTKNMKWIYIYGSHFEEQIKGEIQRKIEERESPLFKNPSPSIHEIFS